MLYTQGVSNELTQHMGWNFFSHERKMSRDSYKNNNLFFLAMNNYISLHYKLVKVDVGSVPGLLGSSEGWQWCLWDAFVRLSYGEDGITKTKWHLILFWYIFVIATWCVQMGRLHTTRHSSEIKWLCTCLKASNFFFYVCYLSHDGCLEVSQSNYIILLSALKSFWLKK